MVASATGSPPAHQSADDPNKDWENWQRTMAVEAPPAEDTPGHNRPAVTRPRPGHVNLAGVVKYRHTDIRNVLERASARETASRVAVGAICKQFLEARHPHRVARRQHRVGLDRQPVGCDVRRRARHPGRLRAELRQQRRRAMKGVIDVTKENGDTVGGSFEGDRARTADRSWQPRAVGPQTRRPARPGADVHPGRRSASASDRAWPTCGLANPRRDPAARWRHHSPEVPVSRPTNNAGGLEAGVANGEDLRVTGYMKPIATLMKPLQIGRHQHAGAQPRLPSSAATPVP